MKHTKLSMAIASAAILAVGTQFAGAVPTIRVSDGLGNSVTIADEGPALIVGTGMAFTGGDITSGLGQLGKVSFNGSVGLWNLSVDTGTTKPYLGSPTNPSMDLLFLASGGVGTLTVEFSESFFGPTSGGGLVAGIGGTTQGVVNYTTFFDVANILFAGVSSTNQGPFTGSFSGDDNGVGPAAGYVPFSLTQVVTITHTGSTQLTSGDAGLTVPDGGTTLALLGGSMLGLGALRRKLVKA